MFDKIYRNKKVFLTGHSGFKGSWLGLWLHSLGAKVYGYSLAPSTTPNHYTLLNSNIFINSNFGDINNYAHLETSLQEVEPEIIFHLAAKSLVRYSYQEPLYTFQTNAIGTLNLLNAARKLKKNLRPLLLSLLIKSMRIKNGSMDTESAIDLVAMILIVHLRRAQRLSQILCVEAFLVLKLTTKHIIF